jgi:hypothetical protein
MTPRARAAACAALLGAAMGVVSLHASGDRPSERAGARRPPFYFMMAYSGTTFGGAHGVENAYRALESPTLRIGVTVPVLYMRTTRGRAQDFSRQSLS